MPLQLAQSFFKPAVKINEIVQLPKMKEGFLQVGDKDFKPSSIILTNIAL